MPTTGRAAPQALLALGYRVAGTLAAAAEADERDARRRRREAGDRSRRRPGGSRGSEGLRGIALKRLLALAAAEGAAGVCAVRFDAAAGAEGPAAESAATASGLALDLAGPAWAVERPRVFASTLDPADLAAMIRAGYHPRGVVPLELRTRRTSAGPAATGVLVGPDEGTRQLLETLRWAVTSAARPHRGDLVLTGALDLDARFVAGGVVGGTVEVVARTVADVLRYDAGHPAPQDPPARSSVSLRRPRSPVDARALADRVRR